MSETYGRPRRRMTRSKMDGDSRRATENEIAVASITWSAYVASPVSSSNSTALLSVCVTAPAYAELPIIAITVRWLR